jgi:succinyl-CoA synthetase alpha subunit
VALDAMLEVFEAGIRLAVLYTEGVPVHDAMRMCAYARARGAYLLGPNSAGVMSPGRANMADIADASVQPGRVGIVSKSGTLTYEVIDSLAARGFGISSVVCLGGDPVVGTSYTDVLKRFETDTETDGVVLIGEPGGTMEYAAIDQVAGMTTPVIAYITGQFAPAEKRMGHAGAISGNRQVGAAAKLDAFRAVGCSVCDIVTDVGAAVAARLR